MDAVAKRKADCRSFSPGKSFLLRFSAFSLREGDKVLVGGRGGHEEPIGKARRASEDLNEMSSFARAWKRVEGGG